MSLATRVSKRLDAKDADISDKDIKDALHYPDSFAYFNEREDYKDGIGMFKTWSYGFCVEHDCSELIDEVNAIALRKYLESDPSLKGSYVFGEASCSLVGHRQQLLFKVFEHPATEKKIKKLAKEYRELVGDDRSPEYGPNREKVDAMRVRMDGLFDELAAKGKPSRIFRVLKSWFDGLRDYPVADDDLYSEISYERTIDSIETNGRHLIVDEDVAAKKAAYDALPEEKQMKLDDGEVATGYWVSDVGHWLGNNGSDSTYDGWVGEDEIEEALRALGYQIASDE
jgi:hypothetical protein